MKYAIKSGNTEAVISSVGGTVLTFKVNGEDILYPWSKTSEGKERGGCPICAPWFESQPDFGEKKHGHLRNLNACGVEIIAANILELYFLRIGDKEYPWTFFYIVRYTVEEGQLMLQVIVQRLIDGNGYIKAPIDLAFHPYFIVGKTDPYVINGSSIRIYFSEKTKSCTLNKDEVKIETGRRQKISMRLGGFESAGRSKLILWSDSPEKYFCVEPELIDKNFFNTPNGTFLEVGEIIAVRMILSVV